MDVMSRDLLSVDEVAAFLDVGPVTIYRWCRDGRLPCTKIGKSWRIHRSALVNLDFVESMRADDQSQLQIHMRDGTVLGANRDASKILRDMAI